MNRLSYGRKKACFNPVLVLYISALRFYCLTLGTFVLKDIMKLVWVLGLASVLVAAAPSGCDVSRAYKILEGVSTARRFCSSLLYPHGICTHTTTTTTKIGPTSCVDKTKTKTERDVYTET